ncbi:MAG: alpha/beta hydrolase [Candidatus Saccharimonadales bacterium]
MDYQTWDRDALQKTTYGHSGSSTAVWSTKPNGKPLIILVHGISGDHHGLAAIAYELSSLYQIAIVELPGHGNSDPIPLPDAKSLQRWFSATLKSITTTIGNPALICAHSFGCSAVLSQEIIDKYTIILLNPVPTPSRTYARYAKGIMRSASFWAHIYNWPFLVYLRGRALMQVRSKAARKRVSWAGHASRANYTQTVYQAGLVDMILDGSAYRYASDGKVKLVICGLHDTTATQRDHPSFAKIFGSTEVTFVSGGHLLPIESPDVVARIIKSSMLH